MKSILLIIVLLLCLATPGLAFDVSGYLFTGQYISHDDHYANAEQTAEAEYRAGTYLEVKLWKDHLKFYNKLTVLMDERKDNLSFHPAGAKFNLGLSLQYKQHELRFEHECWHPVDTDGVVGEYNLVEYRLNF